MYSDYGADDFDDEDDLDEDIDDEDLNAERGLEVADLHDEDADDSVQGTRGPPSGV